MSLAILVPTAQAGHQVNPIHKPVAKMTLQQQVRFYRANVFHAQVVLKWFHTTGSWTLNINRYPQAYSVASREIRFHRNLLRNATRNLKQVLRKLQPVYPPHILGWLCIHGSEAGDWHNNDTGGNGHYGGMQMHSGWGYGTSKYASDDSMLVQVWAAEHGYNASNHSRTWLISQWGQTIGSCWGYFADAR